MVCHERPIPYYGHKLRVFCTRESEFKPFKIFANDRNISGEVLLFHIRESNDRDTVMRRPWTCQKHNSVNMISQLDVGSRTNYSTEISLLVTTSVTTSTARICLPLWTFLGLQSLTRFHKPGSDVHQLLNHTWCHQREICSSSSRSAYK